ncbi:MAG: ankyrin repeat domain-containing protein [Campylobacterota bacterium]|nr:ankyrin repeat domain-containing protein [Campylobacterota bacterium]
MLESFFKKDHNNLTFLQELLQEDINEQWLKEGLEEKNIDINYQDKRGDTFLLKCTKVEKYKSVLWLINHNANITIKNNENQNILDIAIAKKHTTFLKMLIDTKKIDLEYRDDEGRTTLQNAVVFGYNDAAKLLIKNGANINNKDNYGRTVIYDAISFGDERFISYLLSQGDIELNLLDKTGNSIMHHPQVLKDDSIAKDLLKSGANPTLKNSEGDSFLFTTALRGEDASDVIDEALKNKADVNATTSNDNTIMMELIAATTKISDEEKARRKGLLKTAAKMLRSGGDINAIEKNNESGLFNAVRLRDYDLTSFLLSGGIDPNIQNDNGETALSLLVYDGTKSLDLILLIIAYGGTANIKNRDGETLYEVLNNIILHNHGTKLITNPEIIKKINSNSQYITIVKELLEEDKDDLNYLDSTGDPLFFKPLLYDHFTLFKLYISHGLDIHKTNKANHNIFFEYVLNVFENDKDDKHFQNNISSLLSSKVEKNYQDALGWTILHKIVGTHCNERLFDILTKVVLFNYKLQDKQGRTVIHNAVWGNKPNIIKKIDAIDNDVINIFDNYGILPITYAALLGSQEMVITFLELGSNIRGAKTIAPQAVKKFKPMLKNLDELKLDLENPSVLHNIDVLIDEIKRDFR